MAGYFLDRPCLFGYIYIKFSNFRLSLHSICMYMYACMCIRMYRLAKILSFKIASARIILKRLITFPREELNQSPSGET